MRPAAAVPRPAERAALPAVVAALVCLAALPAQAQTTALFVDSQSGDFVGAGMRRTYTLADGTFESHGTTPNEVYIAINGSSPFVSWHLHLSAPQPAPLQTGAYRAATRWPFTPFAGMSVSGDGRGCNQLTGWFLVRELVRDADGNVERLAVDFEQHCEDRAPALFGALRYNSTVTSLVPFDGQYPLYRLEVAPPAGGTVTGDGLACDSFGLACAVTLGSPATVSITATPDPGYQFTGWSGTCTGSLTSTVYVNTDERCQAHFVPLDATGLTMVALNSQPGDWVGQGAREMYNAANSRWVFSTFLNDQSVPRSVMLSLEGMAEASTARWNLHFHAPVEHALTPGTYVSIANAFTGARLSVSGHSRGCNQTSGSFTVHEVTFAGAAVASLAVDFEQHCEGPAIPPRPLRGSLRYNSSVPPIPTLAITMTGSRGRVVLGPPGTVCTFNCTEAYQLGTVVSMTATPDPGFLFTGWAGDADCLDGEVVMLGPLSCEPQFIQAVHAVAVTPSSGSGAAQTFTFEYESSAGATQIATAWVWFNATFASSAAHSCLVYYERAGNRLLLLNDAGTVWQSAALGSATTLQNSQCAVAPGSSSVATSGDTLTLTLSVSFRVFGGAKSVFLYASGANGAASGWHERGTWIVPAITPMVTASTVAPASGSGTTRTFTLTYASTFGAAHLQTAWVWFNASFAASAAHSCLVYYESPTNTLFLLNDAGTVWQSATLGSATTLQNSQCALAAGSSSVALSGSTLTVHLAMTFHAAFAGDKQVYLYTAAIDGTTSGWHDRGDWTVPSPVSATTVTPTAGAGTTQTFALAYANTRGATDLRTTWVWFNATFAASAAHSCLVYYEPPTNTLFLLNDAGTVWQSAPLGGATALQNSQCTVTPAGSSVVTTANTLTLHLAMTFHPAFAGPKQVYLYAAGADGIASGWHDRGDWSVPSPVSATAVTPASGSGATQTFALAYASTFGAADLSSTWVWFNATFAATAAGSCLVHYQPATNTLFLLNDAGTVWLPATLGTASTLQNSQCAIAAGSSSAVPAGTTLTLNLAVTFSPAFTGSKRIYLYAAGAQGTVSGWYERGAWTVP